MFAEGLLVPHSVMPVEGGAYVCSTTELLFLADTDLAGLPPDVSPYFSVLREIPGFDDWFVRFNERRKAMHDKMTKIADGI